MIRWSSYTARHLISLTSVFILCLLIVIKTNLGFRPNHHKLNKWNVINISNLKFLESLPIFITKIFSCYLRSLFQKQLKYFSFSSANKMFEKSIKLFCKNGILSKACKCQQEQCEFSWKNLRNTRRRLHYIYVSCNKKTWIFMPLYGWWYSTYSIRSSDNLCSLNTMQDSHCAMCNSFKWKAPFSNFWPKLYLMFPFLDW